MRRDRSGLSVLIPVAAVGRVAVSVMDVVDVVAVLYRFVAAPGAVLVVVTGVGHVLARLALVPLAVVRVVRVPVVQVVGVVTMAHRSMTAPFPVGVRVIGVVLVAGFAH